jgi:hypothetical protein
VRSGQGAKGRLIKIRRKLPGARNNSGTTAP